MYDPPLLLQASYMKKETKLEELERRIIALEQRPYEFAGYRYIPQPQQNFPHPNLHFHGQMPCYQNPCVWC